MENKFDFVYEEYIFDTAGRNMAGIISNGNIFLFFHAFTENEGELEYCYIYPSLQEMFSDGEGICRYEWTSENDEKVINALNSMGDDRDWYETLSTLKFK